MKKVAIVGIQGVPAKYGGFETLVENIIGENCSEDVQYTVFCSSRDFAEKRDSYKGVSLKYVPIFHANGAQSTLYDILSMMRCIRGYDTVVILGVSGCIFLPVFRMFYSNRLIINIDGLEHRRDKWGGFAKWFLRKSEAMAVKYADVVIADNKGIVDYVTETYGKQSQLIAYGGDHVMRCVSNDMQRQVLEKYGLEKGDYSISVCRIEPENNCHITLEAFAGKKDKLVFIGNWDRSDYGKSLRERYSEYSNIRILDAVYDLDVLYTLRSNARLYIHGHSAGGTNPSLVEAMFFGIPIACYDVVYNRETTFDKAYYYCDSSSLFSLVCRLDLSGSSMHEIASEIYTWKHIALQYEDLY
ncbi:MAG: DUF1972 domain-containing protein [Muribaculaceae bacterium]